jgi:amino acid adenylation domain-containing protein
MRTGPETRTLLTPEEGGREFWQSVLHSAGSTTIPRWTLNPVPGYAQHDTWIPDVLTEALRKLAVELEVSRTTVLLAAHAKVIATLSGEQDVVTGYVATRAVTPLPCRLSTRSPSWRGVIMDAGESELDLRAHADFPVEDLKRELGFTATSLKTVFDPTGGGVDISDDTTLTVTVVPRDGDLLLRLRYRTDVLDSNGAARIAGYHLTALTLITSDADAEHARQTLLSAEEIEFQLEGLAGPHRELPDLRVHELFERRVAAQPDAVAAVHGGQKWTYRELNRRANQLGRALQARGLRREDVVAVVTERTLDWMAAVLAILKAGGVYLPLEPHFPATRMATALSRAECTLVLTERGSSTTLDEAIGSLSWVERLFIADAYAEGHADSNLGVEVTSGQLAYILFTSGSTGEPKGAMCEHAGMLNHMYAKLDDLEVGEGEVIPQTGPQCFDISVWQLLAALLVGGRTLLVEQEAIVDVERFVDTVVAGRAAVLQVVPSYLDVLLSYLEQHPRELPDLHTVSPTGDFLKMELVQRWFATYPHIKLVNTYGLTETSDDAVHEVMDGVPEAEQVPLGRPINNVHVYVTDENLHPVPLGAPGLIMFSGVCVGRGYVNDPERTGLMFTTDPHRDGQRLCRSGDYGRWLPDGKLEFLGRRDHQVKIRGFRIEIGEVDNALPRVPGVRDGAAVVVDDADLGKRLVAFYSAREPLQDEVLRDHLAELLPEYMVPSTFSWREALPLTPNGKIDRTTLTALAEDLGTGEEDYASPSTPTEQRIAAAWATVLSVPQDKVGRHDHFFDRGGTSLTAVRLVVALNRAVSLKDVTQHPVLADLAQLLEERCGPEVAAPSRGG